MRHARVLRGGLAVLSIGWVMGSAGCIQNYYPTPYVGSTGAIPYGSVCDVPSGGGTVISQSPARTTVAGATPPRVVVSQPSPGLSWRRSDPESLATTRVEGNIDEPTLNR